MRWLAGLLLALNLGVLAAGLGMTYWPKRPVATLEFNGDKVKLLAAQGASGPDGAVSEPPAVSSARLAEPVKSIAPGTCLSWQGLDAEQFLALDAHLVELGLARPDFQLEPSAALGWWVFLPPIREAAKVRAVMAELRDKGVTDMARVRGGKLTNAISLGAFKTLDKAREHATSLMARGVAGIRYGPRPEVMELRLLWPEGSARPTSLSVGWPKGMHPAVCVTE